MPARKGGPGGGEAYARFGDDLGAAAAGYLVQDDSDRRFRKAIRGALLSADRSAAGAGE